MVAELNASPAALADCCGTAACNPPGTAGGVFLDGAAALMTKLIFLDAAMTTIATTGHTLHMHTHT